MAKKPNKYKKFTDWCLGECWRIQKKIDITSYRVSIEIDPAKTNDDYAFEITCHYPYQTATLKWKEETYEDWLKDKNKITVYLLHEMIHILIEPFAQIAKQRYVTQVQINDADEELTDRLTNILRFGILKN